MATAKSLQTPQIIGINASTIKIRHPDLLGYPRTFLRSSFTAAGTTLTVGDNNGFTNADYLILGEVADGTTEEINVNAAVTRGASLTIGSSTKFGHNINDPVTRIQERQITLYGASSDGGSLTAIFGTGAAKSIQWDKTFTEITLSTTETAYAYYAVKFYDGTTESSASDYIASTGYGAIATSSMIDKALRITNQEIDNLITYSFLISAAQDCQDEILQYSYQDASGNMVRKDWAFEVIENDTSLAALTMEHRYAVSSLSAALKYTDSKQAIMDIRFGNQILKYVSPQDMDVIYEGIIVDELNAAVSSGATSITLDNSSEFAASGSISLGGDTITYTANATSTGVLSGIPASGTGSITASYSAGRAVFQGTSGGLPERYTIFDGEIILDRPASSTYANYKIKVRYLRAANSLSELGDTTIVTFTNAFKWYIAAQIAYRKGQADKALQYMAEFNKIVLMNAKGEISPILETYNYYQFSDGNNMYDFAEDIRFPNNP